MATTAIKLYTNHACPWAYRAHIALHELGLPFEEEIIDLGRPRDASYLAINPRGLVPTLSYDGQLITESAIIAQFLADLHPGHLEKSTTEPGGALQRARINFFVDTFQKKIPSLVYGAVRASGAEKVQQSATLVDTVSAELEPLLGDAKPFFGGSEKLTLAEIQCGSFILRLLSFPKYDLLPESLLSELETRAPNFMKWAQAVFSHKSVTHLWDAETTANQTKERILNRAAAAAK